MIKPYPLSHVPCPLFILPVIKFPCLSSRKVIAIKLARVADTSFLVCIDLKANFYAAPLKIFFDFANSELPVMKN